MESTTCKLQTLRYSDAKTYLVALLFIAGNVLLPQLCHLLPNGGFIFLPIYFFTLVGAYRYGWKAGLVVAVCSPLINSLLFGMPALGVLPAILMKSVLLALCAGLAASYFKRVSIPLLIGVVVAYQLVGTLGEWALSGDFMLAIQDFRMAIPGMLLQVVGGYWVIRM
ncbi:MAG: ECF transporter S component [Prevotellaceae bacterium]|nr:ECF transporter S component [Prevotellaceae bacterium]